MILVRRNPVESILSSVVAFTLVTFAPLPEKLVALTVPSTSNVVVGLSVPIPTRPVSALKTNPFDLNR